MPVHYPYCHFPIPASVVICNVSNTGTNMLFLPSGSIHVFSFYTSFLVATSSIQTKHESTFAWNSEIYFVLEQELCSQFGLFSFSTLILLVGSLTCKTVSRMIYTVLVETLNPTHSLTPPIRTVKQTGLA